MTLLESLAAAGDHVLSRAIGKVDAGACVSSVHRNCDCRAIGQCHKCTPLGIICPSGFNHVRYSCFGACNSVTANCC